MKTAAPALMLATFLATPLLGQGTADLPDRPIARSEVQGVVRRQFAAMDANHDGIVTPAEFQAYRARTANAATGPFGHVGGHWYEHADAKGDGRVTLAEAEERPLRLFDTADLNHDGVISLEERKLALLFMGGR